MDQSVNRLKTALQDRYRIEGGLGEGGMATVYLSVDLKHERKVALKILKPELAAVLGAERFLQEIKVTANLHHPHILPLHDSGTAEGMVYYVMPYVEGESLRDRLDREKQLPVDEAVRIGIAAGSALDYAHRRDVVHRDIKPANILLQDGEPVVADFGIALAVNAAGGGRLTETGLSVGTPHYMSPEQAAGDRTVDGRTDVYALAATVYEILTGEPPYTGSSAQAVLAKILTEKAPLANEVRETTPTHVALSLRKALNKLPADRFATAGDFVEGLKRPELAAALAESMSGEEPGPGGVRRRSRREALWLAAAAGAAGLALGVIGANLSRPPPTEPEAISMTVDASDDLEIVAVGDREGAGWPAAVSNDGRTLVFVGRTSDGGQRLYRRPLNGFEIEAIERTEDAREPTFTPDGRSIIFSRGTTKYVVSVAGGVPREVAPGVIFPFFPVDMGVGYGMTTRGEVVRVSLQADDAEVIARPDSGAALHHAQLLPDGRSLLASVGPGLYGPSTYQESELVLIDVASGEVRPLGTDGTPVEGALPRLVEPNYLVFFRDGEAVYAPFDADAPRLTGPAQPFLPDIGTGHDAYRSVNVSRGGHVVYQEPPAPLEHLVWVEMDGLEAGTLEVGGPVGSFDLSADGRRVAVEVDGDIWIHFIETGAPPLPLTFGEQAYRRPSWSPDGSFVFVSGHVHEDGQGAAGERSDDLYRIAADGGGSPELVRDEELGLRQPVVGRGGEIVFVKDLHPVGGHLDIHAAVDGWDDVREVVASDGHDYSPALSADGRYLAYVSNLSGTPNVYVTSFPDGTGRRQLSNGGGWQPVWGPDGRRVFYRTETEYRVAHVETAGGFRLASVDGLFPIEGHVTVSSGGASDVAPDGRLLMIPAPPSTTRLRVVLNWSHGLPGSG